MSFTQKTVVLVTGGAGYIGSHTCKALQKAGFLPVCYDNLQFGKKHNVRFGSFVKGDLLDLATLENAFLQYKPQAVIHFAGLISVPESIQDPIKYYQNNVTGSLNLLQMCQKFGVHSFIFSSSCCVYGMPKHVPIDESCPLNPINPYGKTKKIIEEVLQEVDFLQSISLRYFNAAGADIEGELGEEHEPETHLIPNAILAALETNPFYLYGNDFPTQDGYAVRDFIHVTDLANVHVLSLEYLLQHKKSHILNVGTGCGISVKQICNEIERLTQKPLPIQLCPKRKGDSAQLIANPTKLQQLLRYTPQHSSLSTIIETAYKWHLRQEKKVLLSTTPP